jgi:hypothetical protein
MLKFNEFVALQEEKKDKKKKDKEVKKFPWDKKGEEDTETDDKDKE